VLLRAAYVGHTLPHVFRHEPQSAAPAREAASTALPAAGSRSMGRGVVSRGVVSRGVVSRGVVSRGVVSRGVVSALRGGVAEGSEGSAGLSPGVPPPASQPPHTER
jgi:hypothetical protein